MIKKKELSLFDNKNAYKSQNRFQALPDENVEEQLSNDKKHVGSCVNTNNWLLC